VGIDIADPGMLRYSQRGARPGTEETEKIEMTNAKVTTERIESFRVEVEKKYGVGIEVTGGGRGWRAEATDAEGVIFRPLHSSTSKMDALITISNALDDMDVNGEDEPEDDFDMESCSAECQSANPNSPCSCKCGGANHPKADGGSVVVMGEKQCACGCGQVTKRRYVAGHDARHHFALRAEAAGMTVEEYRKVLKAGRNAEAAAKRREARAAAKAVVA
jgi:hypothetical protein